MSVGLGLLALLQPSLALWPTQTSQKAAGSVPQPKSVLFLLLCSCLPLSPLLAQGGAYKAKGSMDPPSLYPKPPSWQTPGC